MRADVEPKEKKIRYWIPISLFIGIMVLFLFSTPIVGMATTARQAIIDTGQVTVSIYRYNSTNYALTVSSYSVHIMTKGIPNLSMQDGQCLLFTFTATGKNSLDMSENIMNVPSESDCHP